MHRTLHLAGCAMLTLLSLAPVAAQAATETGGDSAALWTRPGIAPGAANADGSSQPGRAGTQTGAVNAPFSGPGHNGTNAGQSGTAIATTRSNAP